MHLLLGGTSHLLRQVNVVEKANDRLGEGGIIVLLEQQRFLVGRDEIARRRRVGGYERQTERGCLEDAEADALPVGAPQAIPAGAP